MDESPRNTGKLTITANIKQLKGKCLVIPTTSAPFEKLLSIAGKIFSPASDRCTINDSTFENLMMIKLMMIKCNSEVKE